MFRGIATLPLPALTGVVRCDENRPAGVRGTGQRLVVLGQGERLSGPAPVSASVGPAAPAAGDAPSAPGRRNHPSDRQQIAPVRADPFRFRAGRFGSPGDQLAGTRRSSARPATPVFPGAAG